jgi:hypothetical protein
MVTFKNKLNPELSDITNKVYLGTWIIAAVDLYGTVLRHDHINSKILNFKYVAVYKTVCIVLQDCYGPMNRMVKAWPWKFRYFNRSTSQKDCIKVSPIYICWSSSGYLEEWSRWLWLCAYQGHSMTLKISNLWNYQTQLCLLVKKDTYSFDS